MKLAILDLLGSLSVDSRRRTLGFLPLAKFHFVIHLEGSSLKLRFTGLFYDFYFDVLGHLLWNNTGGEKKNNDTNNDNSHNPTGTTKARQQGEKYYFERN